MEGDNEPFPVALLPDEFLFFCGSSLSERWVRMTPGIQLSVRLSGKMVSRSEQKIHKKVWMKHFKPIFSQQTSHWYQCQVRPQIFSAGTDARILRELGIPTIGMFIIFFVFLLLFSDHVPQHTHVLFVHIRGLRWRNLIFWKNIFCFIIPSRLFTNAWYSNPPPRPRWIHWRKDFPSRHPDLHWYHNKPG